ncbi:hypothetical protein [Bifidobacterium adolescentis]|uniref:hypothetical protein n=1 Tax=Bifidobacterium adolescentis TaxID=1680 RepID=UPI003BB56945
MREPNRISNRRIGLTDVLGVVAAVLLGVQSLNFIMTLISNYSATFMIFGYESGGNAIVGMLGVLLLLVLALIPAALSGFPALGLIKSSAVKLSSPSSTGKNPERFLVPAIVLLLIEIVLWILALIKPMVQIPYIGPVLALMGPKAMKEIISSVVIVVLLYAAHVKSKNV